MEPFGFETLLGELSSQKPKVSGLRAKDLHKMLKVRLRFSKASGICLESTLAKISQGRLTSKVNFAEYEGQYPKTAVILHRVQ